MKNLVKLAIFPVVCIAMQSTNCYAVYEKDFNVNVLSSDTENGIKSGNYLKAAVQTLKEVYRLHLEDVISKNGKILKKYDLKTITEVIPSEIIASKLNIHTNDDESVDYNNAEEKTLECLGKRYKNLSSYTQSNFNYIMLINVLDMCVANDDAQAISKAKTKILEKDKYKKFSKLIDAAEKDLSEYFETCIYGISLRRSGYPRR